jgi:tight adherence protein B
MMQVRLFGQFFLKNRKVAEFVLRRQEKKRLRELRREMPEALRLLCIALDSGQSLVKALLYAANNCQEPLALELKQAVWDLEAGHGFDEAMENLRSRSGGSEFAYLAVAMEIQHRSGGSLTGVLATVSKALSDSFDMDEELKTKTTQGRLSARIVATMPIILLMILSLFSQNYFGLFFSSSLGILMLIVAIVLEFVGVLFVRRTLAIDFSSGIGKGM